MKISERNEIKKSTTRMIHVAPSTDGIDTNVFSGRQISCRSTNRVIPVAPSTDGIDTNVSFGRQNVHRSPIPHSNDLEGSIQHAPKICVDSTMKDL
ncbi:hypothetical protein CHS0354_002267 [Potamilus streckersoni]|uniref:Uncharacterized protein n=1 Tax=Potamilus streckersoni TaxID=2493646 RepID=A0AAE0S3X8_9BIVA|nr:hypothetical protein CHS0354_002267 [Potamilus streckersoni]